MNDQEHAQIEIAALKDQLTEMDSYIKTLENLLVKNESMITELTNDLMNIFNRTNLIDV